MKVLVYIDQFDGKALPSSWETIGAAKALGTDSIEAVIIGASVDEIANEAFGFGADTVYTAEDAAYKDYDASTYTSVLTEAAKTSSSNAVILPTTTRGNELAAMLAVDLETGVLVDVVKLDASDGKIRATRPIYAGKALSVVECAASPVIITTRNRAFPNCGSP